MLANLPFSSQEVRDRVTERHLTSKNHALDMGPYGHNHVLLVSTPAASVYPGKKCSET